jgi:hypothetical protein
MAQPVNAREIFRQMGKQLNLFAPNLNTGPRLKAAMREAIRKSPFSREIIVEHMKTAAIVDGVCTGRGCTISMANLDAWCSESHVNLIPTSMLTIFCKVTGSIDPIRVIAAPLGGTVVDEKEAKLLAWARLEVQGRGIARRKKKILSEIEGETSHAQ